MMAIAARVVCVGEGRMEVLSHAAPPTIDRGEIVSITSEDLFRAISGSHFMSAKGR
jgi:hypothetical protein